MMSKRAYPPLRREPRVMKMCYGHSGRRYYSREERTAWLEDYARDLENELKGVRERIADLSRTSA